MICPDATWYQYETEADHDEIIEEHLLDGRIVERLKIPDHKPGNRDEH